LNTLWKQTPAENLQPQHYGGRTMSCINLNTQLTHKNKPLRISQFHKTIVYYGERWGEPAKKAIQKGENQNEGALRAVYLRGNRWMCSLGCSLPVSVVSPSKREQHMQRVCENMLLPCAREQAHCAFWRLSAISWGRVLPSGNFNVTNSLNSLSAFLFCKAVETSQHKLHASLAYFELQISGGKRWNKNRQIV